MKTTQRYFRELTQRFGAGWNRFWFTPADVFGVCVLRLLTGLAAVYYVLSHTADLVVWFGPSGLLPVETVRQLATGGDPAEPYFHLSYWNYVDEPVMLWSVHLLGLLVVLAFAMGLFTRVTAVLSLVVVLSYVHRAPMIAGQFEPVLTMLILYLCLAPCSTCLSVDRLLWKRRAGAATDVQAWQEHPQPSVAANISLRLTQVHLAALYLMMGLTKLGGETWWMGDAVWWLAARTESRLVDLTFLHGVMYLVNVWTHTIIVFELCFGVLIWNRLARPLLLGWAVMMWSSLALITGLASFCLIMLIANLCFVSPESMRGAVERCGRSLGPKSRSSAPDAA